MLIVALLIGLGIGGQMSTQQTVATMYAQEMACSARVAEAHRGAVAQLAPAQVIESNQSTQEN